jgi:polyisoprenyl-teichoic acid--peptidoglycan teichoic acid transferase
VKPRPPRASKGMWKRFALAGVVIVLLAGGSAATVGFMEVRDITSALSLGKTVQFDPNDITEAEAGKAQTILLLGSDKRVGSDPLASGARSDTIMLVRLNPQADAVTVMNIPRDLKVDIPGRGSDKINASYDYGGPRLTLKTVKQLLGIDINHVVNVNFSGFSDIIDSLNCVFLDIDRRYFNENVTFADIDIQPGYQKLCGYDALEYARFREEDSDLVRAARQQDILREAKAQISSGKLFSQRRKLVRIFGKYSETDKSLRSSRQVLRLLKLALFSARKPVAQVEFPAIIPDDPSNTYLGYKPEALRTAVQAFMTGKSRVTNEPKLKSTRAEREAAARRKRQNRKEARGNANLEDAEKAGEDQAIAIANKVPYPVYFPRFRVPLSTYVDNAPRVYKIRASGRSYTSYRMVLKKGGIGEYYGVQGTSWKAPPILSDPHETQKIGGRSFDVYYDGRRIRLVAWRTSRAVYWVSNTLTSSLRNQEMLGIVRSLKRLA